MFYVTNNDTAASKITLPYFLNELAQEVGCSIENVWFGLQSIKSNLLCNEDLKRLAGKEKLNGDVIYCFMHGIAQDEIDQGRMVYV